MTRISALLLLVAAPIAQAAEPESPLRAENLWVREAPPVAQVMAGYGRLCNDSDAAVIIAAVSSDAFERVEMHRTTETAARASMQRLNELAIGPNDCVDFAPAGRHFMLFDPARPLRAGSEIELLLTFADGKQQQFVVPVRRQQAADNAADNHGHSHEH